MSARPLADSSLYLLPSLRGRRTKGREGDVEFVREARSNSSEVFVRVLRTRIQLHPSLPFVRRPRRPVTAFAPCCEGDQNNRYNLQSPNETLNLNKFVTV